MRFKLSYALNVPVLFVTAVVFVICKSVKIKVFVNALTQKGFCICDSKRLSN